MKKIIKIPETCDCCKLYDGDFCYLLNEDKFDAEGCHLSEIYLIPRITPEKSCSLTVEKLTSIYDDLKSNVLDDKPLVSVILINPVDREFFIHNNAIMRTGDEAINPLTKFNGITLYNFRLLDRGKILPFKTMTEAQEFMYFAFGLNKKGHSIDDIILAWNIRTQ